MDYETYIREGLKIQGLPVKEEDIPFIQDTLSTINQEQEKIADFPELNENLPIQTMDKEVINND